MRTSPYPLNSAQSRSRFTFWMSQYQAHGNPWRSSGLGYLPLRTVRTRLESNLDFRGRFGVAALKCPNTPSISGQRSHRPTRFCWCLRSPRSYRTVRFLLGRSWGRQNSSRGNEGACHLSDSGPVKWQSCVSSRDKDVKRIGGQATRANYRTAGGKAPGFSPFSPSWVPHNVFSRSRSLCSVNTYRRSHILRAVFGLPCLLLDAHIPT